MQTDKPDFQDQFVRGLSHRMNNILTLFHGYLGLLMENEELDSTTHEGLERIKEGAKVASSLMDRTNALARPKKIVPQQIVVEDFLNQLAPSFEKIAESAEKITVECEPNLPLLWLDPSRLRLALTELIKNACDATQPKGTVHIRCAALDSAPENHIWADEKFPPTHWIMISITDNGRGIAPEIHDQIYMPFATTKKRDTIAGLGLTVVASCLQQIGGLIEHESCPGRTVFRMTLPALRAQKVQSAA